MDKQSNPVQVVKVSDSDHRKINYDGFGDPTVFGDGATQEVRNRLAQQALETLNYFSSSFEENPNVAGVAKVTLREEALAKTHRPMRLFSRQTCPIFGTLDFGEVLVSVTDTGLRKLRQRLHEGNSKQVIANISAVEKIEPFSEEDRLNILTHDQISKLSQEGGRVKLKIFDHQNKNKNDQLRKALEDFAVKQKIELKELRYGSNRELISATSISPSAAKKLAKFIGLRNVSPIPRFKASDIDLQASPVGHADELLFPPPNLGEDYPIVGMIDSGICPNSSLITPWIVSRESYVPPGFEDHTHGTMVAGLIINSQSLNHLDARFPSTQAKVVDVNVFPNGGTTSEDDLIAIIEEVVPKYPEVKVWNLSLGSSDSAHNTDFSDFAHFLDEMHDEHGCLFVVAAGNQTNVQHWPTNNCDPLTNRVSSPGDSIRALTVGSIAHKTSPLALGDTEGLSPFSRIGPGPSCIPKPEITHYGGNATATGSFAQIGVLSLGPNDTLCENIGTSFAAPIASSIAGHLHHFLSDGGTTYVPSERIKALMIHSALLGSQGVSTETLNYFGFGKPGDVIDHLYCDPNCMTMVFETDIKHGGFEFERFPFPIPDCLNTSEGKYKGEILMTLVYSPETDKNYASEYCRTNVEVGMGSYKPNENGKRAFSSKVPAAPKNASDMFEKARVENGFKWSPVKAYHKISSRGIDVGDWRLRLGVLRRAEMEMPDKPQRAILVLSLRGLDPTQPVYNETIQKINQMGWVTYDIDQHVRVRS